MSITREVAPHAGARIKIVGLTHSFIRAIVAPCAGARIEMFGLSCQKRRWPRRTPRGCVNRNQGVGGCTGCALCGRVNRNAPRVAEPTMTCCRTLRGCANRNLANAIILAIQMSHPARVRESKSVAVVVDFNLTESHPTRVRESKYIPAFQGCPCRTPCGVRESK